MVTQKSTASQKGKYILGMDIGGTKCAVVLGNEKMRIFDRISFPTQTSRGLKQTLKQLMDSVEDILKRNHLTSRSIHKAGVSCGGPLDSRKGLILSPPNLPGWNKVPIVQMFQKKLGCSVHLENDANACAVAEWKFGAGRGCRNMIFLTFGTGLGAGLILDARLYRGTNDMAGEAGHIRLAPQGPEGYGKSGSFEGFCSGGGIARLAKTQGAGNISVKELCEAAARGNKKALRILNISGRHLGMGLSILIDLLNPEKIILGGIYSRSGKFFYPSAREIIHEEALARSLSVCKIVPSGLGEKIGDIASLSAALMD